MKVTVLPSDEGNTLRSAATSMRERFPAASAHLLHLARLADLRVSRDRQVQLDTLNTRGRWVRRTRGNGGPGIPGRGHIATLSRRTPLNSTSTLCGRSLLGDLTWEVRAKTRELPPSEWSICRPCFTALQEATDAVRAVG